MAAMGDDVVLSPRARKDIQSISFHSPRPTLMRRDVLPFVVAYLAVFYAVLTVESYAWYLVGMIVLVLLVAAHILTAFMRIWSVGFRVFIECYTWSAADIDGPVTLVWLIPPSNQGVAELVPLGRDHPTVRWDGDTKSGEKVPWFSFQKKKFLMTRDAQGKLLVDSLVYPTSLPLSTYHQWRGARVRHVAPDGSTAFPNILDADDVSRDGELMQRLVEFYGNNEFGIPIPGFLDLFKEHAVAPLFVFQVFSMLLWLLDEYWYYSLLTLGMLIMFEGITVKQRLKSLADVRAMSAPRYPIFVYHGLSEKDNSALGKSEGAWVLSSSDQLVPGDVVSIVHAEHVDNSKAARKRRMKMLVEEAEEVKDPEKASCSEKVPPVGKPSDFEAVNRVVPADVLILRGACVCDEALLTGESVPQLKESIAGVEGSLNLDVTRSEMKRHMLFAGTKVLLTRKEVSEEQQGGDGDAKEGEAKEDEDALLPRLEGIKPPPDGGLVGFVCTTGFESSQGRLIRTILFSTQRATANTKEAFIFILALLVCAIIAAGYVLNRGLLEGRQSVYKLVLHCIMIITAVVPPELPMQLSLAVNTSLVALMKKKVFCTEPFRIPLGGRLDYCCFDKTGTLTESDYQVKGVLWPSDMTDELGEQWAGTAGGVDGDSSLKEVSHCPFISQVVLAGCQSLAYLNESAKDKANKESSGGSKRLVHKKPISAAEKTRRYLRSQLVGDPMEKSSLIEVSATCGWKLSRDMVLTWRPVSSAPTVSKNMVAAWKQAGVRVGVSATPSGEGGTRLTAIRRFPFASALKRMSCVLASDGMDASLSVVVKGACEVIAPRLKSPPPPGFDEIYQRYALQGCRVLCLAYRRITDAELLEFDGSDEKTLNRSGRRSIGEKLTREFCESQLEFAGFLILSAPLKEQSAPTIAKLNAAAHRCVIITGDHVLTACAVAKQVGVGDRPEPKNERWLLADVRGHDPASATLVIGELWPVLTKLGKNDRQLLSFTAQKLSTTSADQVLTELQDYVKASPDALSGVASTGSVVGALVSHGWTLPQIGRFCELITVYARTSPQQKEKIIKALKSRGHGCLMCGDGTNDVGALKAADVGVALMGVANVKITDLKDKLDKKAPTESKVPEKTPAQLNQMGFMERLQYEMEKKKKELNKKRQAAYLKNKMVDGSKNKGDNTPMSLDDLLEAGEDEVPMVKLGDASIAAPFTSKDPSIANIVDIITQGRCTLVTTLQVFHILALNNLITAYSLSVLFLDGVKMGDSQMTIVGFGIAVMFYLVSQGTPLTYLTPDKPQRNLITPFMWLNIGGQFAVHFWAFSKCATLAAPYTVLKEEDYDWESEFKPNFLNTVVFLVSTCMTLTTFLCNYQGHPFMQSLRENGKLFKGLMIGLGLCFTLSLEVMPELNETFQLVKMPNEDMRVAVTMVMAADVVVTYVWSRAVKRMSERVRWMVLMVVLLVGAVWGSHWMYEYVQSEGEWGAWFSLLASKAQPEVPNEDWTESAAEEVW